MSNGQFLPSPDQEESLFQSMPTKDKTQPTPERRSLWINLFDGEGQSLEECTNSWDLAECLVHSMLGWISGYQVGYLHRDVNIGNIMKLLKPAQREAFSARTVAALLQLPEEFNVFIASFGENPPKDDLEGLEKAFNRLKLDVPGPDTFWDDLEKVISNNELKTPIVRHAREVEDRVNQLGITTECKAILGDFDNAADWRTYFDSNGHMGSLSGTLEFMSVHLRTAVEKTKPYVQSPVDDFDSYFWSALWANVFNTNITAKSKQEEHWKKLLRGSIHEREATASYITLLPRQQNYSSLVRVMSPFLRDCKGRFDRLYVDWFDEWEAVKDGDLVGRLLTFHVYAYRGVSEFLGLVLEHRKSLKLAE